MYWEEKDSTRCKRMVWIINLAHWFGSAVCSQLPADSYTIAGLQLPLCARCTGMYVGGLITVIFHTWRHPRAMGLPRSWVLVVLTLFFCAWAGDGVNSLFSSIPGLYHLYPPENLLRLITGSLMGITLGSFIYVLFNSVVWRSPVHAPILAGTGEFLALIGLDALLVLAVQSNQGIFLYPLVLASLAAILVLNSALMSAFAASLMAPLGQSWRDVRRPITVGTLVALTFLSTIALSRIALGAWLGTPI
jgi:uncharacterized membrane protein